jgi:predicted DNA-binding antitoxin AbrB/MazE fold protein
VVIARGSEKPKALIRFQKFPLKILNMKECNKCHIVKEDNEFAFRNKAKGTLQPYCKECKRKIDKELYTSNHSNRRIKIRSRQNEVQTNLKELLTDIKKNSKCAICGESRWWVLDFHHIRDKRFEVSSLARRGCSLETFKEEIDKCIVLCANCHRDLHYKERNAGVV